MPIELDGRLSFGGGAGATEQNESDRFTRCTRGSGIDMPLLLLLNMDRELEDKVEAGRCKGRGWEEKDEKLFKVVELGVDGLMRDGTSVGRGGDEDLWIFEG
jgi:hypothetical protein